MDLKTIFNDAARGADGPEPVERGPKPPSPDLPGAAAKAPAPSDRNRTGSQEIFNRAAHPLWDDPEPEDEDAAEDTGSQRTAEALAELEAMQAGRAEPYLENNSRPSASVEKAVHTHIEERREFRIAALKAYLEFASEEMTQEAVQRHRNEIELSL